MYFLTMFVRAIVMIGLLVFAWYITSYFMSFIGNMLKIKFIADFGYSMRDRFSQAVIKTFQKKKNKIIKRRLTILYN